MKKELEQRNAELEEMVRQLLEAKSTLSVFRRFWNWLKPCVVPFMIGMMLGSIIVYMADPTPPYAKQQTVTLEQQAAQGGAAIPFSSGSPSLLPWNLQPNDLMGEASDFSLTNTSEEPSPSNPQADSGQTTSERYYRLPLRRTR